MRRGPSDGFVGLEAPNTTMNTTPNPFARGLVLVALALTGARLLPAQEAPTPARFNLGTVPDQTVWAGSSRFLLLHWNGQTGVTMTLTAAPAPVGRLTVEPFDATDWLLTYVPAPEDTTSLTLTVTATAGGAQQIQSWKMTPEPVLPPEADYFGTEKHTQPPAVSNYGVKVFDQPDPLPADLNYARQTLHHVRIVGETVELEPGNPNGLYEAYGDGSRRDLRAVEIIADRVVVRSVIRLKQTAVRIRARQLVFEGAGAIKTTPEETLTPSGTNAKGGLPGADGLPAGDVALEVSEVLTDGPGLRLDLAGGRGQPGGPGQHGAPGSTVDTRWSSVRFCDSGLCKTHTPGSGHVITYYYYTFAGATVREAGTKAWPTDGTDARPSGKPGEGGAGGSLTSTVDLDTEFSLVGGETAPPTLPATWPFDRYAGGAAGSPAKAEHVHFYVDWFTMKSTASRQTAVPGEDARIGRGTTVAGPAGLKAITDRPYAWVDPLVVRKVLQHIRDDYLGNRINAAQDRLEAYVDWLAVFRAHPSWSSVAPGTQLELSQMHDEMTLLLQQIEAGLDYFGNPPAWVPMLSFEVNSTLFRNELDRAMNTLYLTYWLGNKAKNEQQRLNALQAMRQELRTQLEQAKTDYTDAVARLPVLRTQAAELDSRIRTVQNQLEAEEIKLLQDTREPDWVFGLRFGLKLSAMMCQMVPVYQPALGTVGEGLRVASDFNPDRPWGSITGAQNVASYYLSSGFEKSAQDQQAAKDGVDPAQAESKSLDYASALATAGTGLAAGVEDIRGFLKEREAPSEEMLAELERLKSRSPEYRALITQVEALMEQNRAFAEALVQTMQQIGTLSDLMQRNLLAIDALNRSIAPAATVLDDRATAYLEDLERRAFDRLVKYHYYLAKAYEYRLLKPYTEPLALEGLIRKFQEIADLNSDHAMSPAQFDSLKAVYAEDLSAVAETIFTQYNANRPELSGTIRFSLLPDEIEALNAGETVVLNLHHAGFFQPSEENVRIVDLRVAGVESMPESGAYGRTAYVDLYLAHSGISNLKLDGAIYRFRHYNRLTENPMVWGGRYDPVDDQIDPIRPSDASDSLLRSLLSGDAVSDMLLYSRPSAWADLQLSRSYFDSSGQKIVLRSVRLELVYDFTPRNASLGQRDLEVFVTTREQHDSGAVVVSDARLRPYFQVGATDRNQRRDARGRFLRVFNSGTSPVAVTAPAEYGQWAFSRWTDRFGRDLPGGPYTDPVFQAALASDLTLVAEYVPRPTGELRLAPPVLSGGTLTLEWNGQPGVRLQQRADLSSGVWQDVPGSLGQSRVDLSVPGQAAFYRLARGAEASLFRATPARLRVGGQ